MGRSLKAIAVVVEDDYFQGEEIAEILEANGMKVIRCDTAEAAETAVIHAGPDLLLLVTDVDLAGSKTGLDLAKFARERLPDLTIVVTSGTKRDLPMGMAFLEKPWRPLELLRLLPGRVH